MATAPLEGRTAVVYGAGGWVGGAVARAYAESGARVFLAGRSRAALDELLAGPLRDRGLSAQVLDVHDAAAVAGHLREVVRETGRLDLVFNAVTYGDVQGRSLLDLDPETLVDRMRMTTTAQHHVIRAAAGHMVERGEGLISTITGHGPPWPGLGTTALSWGLVEAMLRQWAADLGPHGVRVAWLRTGGFLESTTGNRDYGSSYAGDAEVAEVVEQIREATMLGVIPSIAEAGRAAVYLATAPHVTATAINLTAGAMAD